jgi:hypothetical protein
MTIIDDLPADPATRDDMSRRIVELRRMMATFDYVNLLLAVRVAEAMMREQKTAGVIAV